MPLFQLDTVPEHVAPRKTVENLNDLADVLRGRFVSQIELAEPQSGYRTSNKIRSYYQVLARRCLELTETSIFLSAAGHNLAALMVVRAVYESVARLSKFSSDLEKQLSDIASDEALEKLDAFVNGQTFATKIKKLIELGQHPEVEAENILKAVDFVAKKLKRFRDEYDRLSEFTHPNSFGVFHWFAELSPDGKRVSFGNKDPDPAETLSYVVDGAFLLVLVLREIDTLEARLPALSEVGAKFSPPQSGPAT